MVSELLRCYAFLYSQYKGVRMRAKRDLSSVDLYHVVARGTGRQIIFEDDDDRKTFLRILRHALEESKSELYAWCLMSNHVHLLVHAPIDRIALFMKDLCGTYAQYFNKKTGRTGHLFQERYKSEAIDSDDYLMAVIRYIHNNPVKSGMATVDSYAWSSYSEYVGAPILCSTGFVSSLFSGVDDFAQFHAATPENETILDIPHSRTRTRAMPDALALKRARLAIGAQRLASIKELLPQERDEAILALRAAGLSIRQTERLTGIGRGSIERVWRNAVRDDAENQ